MDEMKKARETLFKVEEATTLLPFLLTQVKGKSRNTVKGLLSRRQVRVNGKTVTQFDHNLRPGQTVSILPPAENRLPELPFEILYEDGELIVIDKPAGLLTVATDKEKLRTAYRMVTDYVQARDRSGRIYVVHRLDRDTSGVVLFAKNEEMKRSLQENWGENVEKRVYLAVTEGRPPEDKGTCRSWLLETVTHLVWSAGPDSGGKEAITHYELLSQEGGYSLLRLNLDTGRKNQIRVQLADLGCPVAGDKQYGASTSPIGRLGLHACELAFVHPRTGLRTVFTAPVPRHFKKMFPGWVQE